MKQFFKFLLASFFGTLITGVILLFLFFMMLVGSLSELSSFGDNDKVTKVKDNSLLHIQFNAPITDRGSKDLNFNFSGFDASSKMGLNDILDNIEKAKTDDRIKGIYIDISSMPAGMATTEEIRNALLSFKDETDKFIVSYSEIYTQNAYYLASVSDEVYLYPEGVLEFKGFGAELMFLKGLLEKWDVDVQIIRGKNNKFKSAVEPLMLDHMSEANREQTMKYMGSMWSHMVHGISEARNIPADELYTIADSLWVRNAKDAVEYKLADRLMYKDEVLALLREKLEIEEDDDINTVAINKYTKARVPKKKEEGKDKEKKSSYKKDRIAVVYAIGDIAGGEGDDQSIGSERISKAIREARQDSTVKAIVFRVNSPGGSALASDVIWREALLAKKEKPFVVSMGDVAASGGYYISCAADRIYANENTITGSIGVFGILPNAENFFKNHLGITFDRAKTSNHADLGTTSRALTPEEYDIIQGGVEEIYDVFLTRVSDGRGLTKAEVDSIGQGRVWSGIDAKEIGLIDEFGGLEEAISYAAEMAELDDYKVKNYPKQKDPFEELVKEISGDVKAEAIQEELGDNYGLYRQYQYIKSIINMKGIQARLPYLIDFK